MHRNQLTREAQTGREIMMRRSQASESSQSSRVLGRPLRHVTFCVPGVRFICVPPPALGQRAASDAIEPQRLAAAVKDVGVTRVRTRVGYRCRLVCAQGRDGDFGAVTRSARGGKRRR